MIINIYKLTDLTNGNFYIGSTKNIKNRMKVHRNNNNNTCISKKIIQNNNYKLEILDKRFIYNKEEGKVLENLYILISKKYSNKCLNISLSHRFTNYRKWYDRQKYLYGGKKEKMLIKRKLIKCN